MNVALFHLFAALKAYVLPRVCTQCQTTLGLPVSFLSPALQQFKHVWQTQGCACVTCSSEICFHLLRRLSNLSSLKGAGICCIFMTLWWPAEPGWDLSGPVYIRIVLYIPVYIYNIFIFYFGSLDRDLFCCFKFIFNMQKLNNPQHWRFNEALCTMCCNISFGKEVFWNGNYLVLGRFTLWPRAEMHLRKDMCKYKRPCSEHQMSQCRMQM